MGIVGDDRGTANSQDNAGRNDFDTHPAARAAGWYCSAATRLIKLQRLLGKRTPVHLNAPYPSRDKKLTLC